jgi:hypothetical protein
MGINSSGAVVTSPTPVTIWENFADIPRAVELVGNDDSDDTFFADTDGSIFMVEPDVGVHTLIPRTPDAGVEHSALSLAHHRKQGRLYFTMNTTIQCESVSVLEDM